MFGAGREVGLEQITSTDPIAHLLHLASVVGAAGEPLPPHEWDGCIAVLQYRWRLKDQLLQFRALQPVTTQVQLPFLQIQFDYYLEMARPKLGHGGPVPVISRFDPGSGLIAEPAEPVPGPAGESFLERCKRVAGTGVAR